MTTFVERPPLPKVLALALPAFLIQFELIAVIAVLPAMARDAGIDPARQALIVDLYSIAFAVLLPAAGYLADRFGRRLALQAGVLLFGLASAIAALAAGAVPFWAGRVGQGAGAAFIACGALAVLSDLLRASPHRAWAFGIIGVATGSAMALGPSLGALLAQTLGWRSLFWINVPLCLGLAVALGRLFAETRDRAARVPDLLGLALSAAALLASVTLLFNLAATDWPAGLKLAVGLLATGLWLAFAISQRRPGAMLDATLFRRAGFVAACGAAFAMSVCYWAALVHLPAFVGALWRLPAEALGWGLLPATAPMMLAPLLGGRLLVRLGAGGSMAAGFALISSGAALLALTAAGDAPWLSVVGMIMGGVGCGLVNPQISSLAAAAAPPEKAGIASGMVTLMRQAGFALGIALLAALLGPGGDRFAAMFGAVAALAGLVTLAAAAGLGRRS